MNVPVRLERPAPQWLLGVVALPRRLRNYTILVCVVGTMVFTANITLLWLDPEPRTRQFLLVLFLCVCIACTRGIQVRRGAEYHPYQFWEYPAIVGLALAPPYLVGTCLTGVFAVQQVYVYFALPEMRPRIPVAFGSMAVVATVWTFAGATLPPVSYVAAFVLGALVLDLFLYGYDYFSAGSRYALEALRDDWAKRMAIPIGLSAVVAAMVHFIGPHRQFLMITPLTLLILYWIIQWQLALASDQRAWRQMEAISSKFIGELDEHTVISVALYESLKLFTASRVEIMLPESLNESGARWYLEMGPGKQIAVEMLPEIGTPTDDESAVPRDPRLVR